jgi:undecaprenyl-diphosphatase
MDLIAFFEAIHQGYMDPWAYLLVFLIAFFESTPLLGFFVPGPTIVIVAGFFAKLGILHGWVVVIAAAIGSILGDILGYWLGRRYGYPFLTHYGRYFFFKREYYTQTKELMEGHAGKALVIGRFNFLTRAFTPFVAGATDVKFPRFITFNIIAGFTWAAAFVLIGILFGHSYQIALKYIGRATIVLVLWFIIIFVIYTFFKKKNKLVKEGQARIPKAVEKIIKAKPVLGKHGKLAKNIRKGKERLRRARAELKARKRARLQDRERHLRNNRR